ncbi:MAG: glutathione S-transferase family protein [Deltaproteobacteria bacterium]|nr:glutathione S-transferase family protein [Deltaproteobacteria bacterium]
MKLYGTTTSPFTRRARVVATELGQAFELVNTATPAGQVVLRELSPIRKVPVAIVDGRALYDSRVITEWLTTTHGWGPLAAPRDRWREHNLVNAIDEAIHAAISLFYLKRDGVAIDGTPYAERQRERCDAIFEWLGTQVTPDGRSFGDGFGFAELSLTCALDWMDFRTCYDTTRAAGVASVRAAWRDRPSLAATRPHD